MSEEPDQREIVAGLRRGSRDAWNALCHQYSSRVWQYVSRLIGNNPDAVADCFQETMLAVAKSGRTIAADTKLWAWLAGIAHNQAALYWRKHYRAATEAVPLDTIETPTASDPAMLLATTELVAAVRNLLTDMNAEQVALLTAKYLDGQSIAEMVESLGGSTESVRSRLARARREFRIRYEQIAAEHESSDRAMAHKASPPKRD